MWQVVYSWKLTLWCRCSCSDKHKDYLILSLALGPWAEIAAAAMNVRKRAKVDWLKMLLSTTRAGAPIYCSPSDPHQGQGNKENESYSTLSFLNLSSSGPVLKDQIDEERASRNKKHIRSGTFAWSMNPVEKCDMNPDFKNHSQNTNWRIVP